MTIVAKVYRVEVRYPQAPDVNVIYTDDPGAEKAVRDYLAARHYGELSGWTDMGSIKVGVANSAVFRDITTLYVGEEILLDS